MAYVGEVLKMSDDVLCLGVSCAAGHSGAPILCLSK